jgi:hypothetical protein
MKKRSSSRRVTTYVQGRHHKKPVHICVSERRERERERMHKCTIDVCVMRGRTSTMVKEKKGGERERKEE